LSINLQRCGIEGAFVLTPSAIGDERGYFKEIYVRSKFQALGIADEFIQDNISVSRQFVLRGLHGDRAMSKLVQVLSGEAFDVIADARPGSPTFGKWEAFALSADNHREIFVPAGCLHGFQALTDGVVLAYKQTAEYDPAREFGVRWDDPQLAIAWPEPDRAIVSARDRGNPTFAETTG